MGDLVVGIGLVEGGGWVVRKIGGWGIGRFIWVVRCCKEVVGWLERRGVRCLEVWLDNYLGNSSVNFGLKCCEEVRGWRVGAWLGCYRD